MDDLISRQAAITAAVEAADEWDGGYNHERQRIIEEALARIPSAERKKGKWKETDDGWDGTYYVCSECGCPWTLIDGTPEDNGMNFCPNCGADMRGEKDE